MAPAWNATAPLPLPLAPAVIVSHAALLDALHGQPPGAVTFTELVPPFGGSVAATALSEYVHPEPWLTVKVCPPIERVPDREAPAVAATLNATVPAPFPLAPPVTVIHEALLVADHPHPAAADTFTEPDPPVAGTLADPALNEYEHPEPSFTVNVCPAIVIVPDREGPALPAALNETVPAPLPLAPPVTVIHASLLVADHPHPAAADTFTDPDPPVAGTLADPALNEYEHPEPSFTVNVCPAIVIVPDREGPAVPDALNETVPAPLPLAPPVTVIHEALLVADHPHPAAADTFTDPDPPAAGTLADPALNEYEHPEPSFTVNVCPAIVIVPDREGPALPAALNVTVPAPEPLAPPVTEIQASLLAADHPHPAPADTFTDPVPPAAGTLADPALNEYVHPEPSLTVKVCPAIVIVPDREGPDVPAALNDTVPAPDPLVPPVTVIHEALLVADHPHPAAADTFTDPVPPAAGTLADPALSEYEHPKLCTTVNVCPAAVSVPVRAGPVLAATLNPTVPLPDPEAPDEIVIQASLLAAVQLQPVPETTLTDAAPPAGVADMLGADSAKLQVAPVERKFATVTRV
ncbi:MAG: hypothetical protein U0Q16_05360 [Bryobacteraceae bacterium]